MKYAQDYGWRRCWQNPGESSAARSSCTRLHAAPDEAGEMTPLLVELSDEELGLHRSLKGKRVGKERA